jgi:cytochrome c-type biogenesis protein CcmH
VTATAEGPARRGPFAPGSPVRRWLPWVLLAVVAVTCLSIAAFGRHHAPTAQDRVNSIARTIKCPTCVGQSALESDVVGAQEFRATIAELVQQGQTDDEIRSYFDSRYEDILLTPSAEGVNLLVWVLPVVAVAVGFGALALAFRRWSADPTTHASEEDRALVAQALRAEHATDAGGTDDGHGEGSSR